MTELDEALRLSRAINRQKPMLEKNDQYFEGEQPLKFLAPVLQQELGYRLSPIVLNLALFAVDVYDNRLDVEGFRIGRGAEADDDLWNVWQENDGPDLSQQGHRESLALGRAYATVGPGESDDDAPIITLESAFDAIHEDDPKTKRVKHGVKRWTDLDKTRWMTFHHQNGWVTWRLDRGTWIEDDREDDNGNNLCSLVPLMNDPRMLGRNRPGKFDQRLGRSAFHSIVSPLDALNKMASDMMVSGEFHALPRRWGTGLEEEDFVDEQGKALDTYSMIAGRMWGTSSKEAKFGQFPEANLSNFHETIKLLMQITSMQLGLPAHYLLFKGDNPPSEGSIVASESQLIKRAERKQRTLSTRWEQVQRLVLMNMGREVESRPKQIETIWRNAATPTIAEKADAIMKLVTTKDNTGRSILPIEQARKDLGYTDIEQGRMRDWDYNVTTDPQIDAASRALQDAAARAEGGVVNGAGIGG